MQVSGSIERHSAWSFTDRHNRGARGSFMHEVVVYSRKGCHLCEVVKETLAQVQGDAEFQWREVDIDADPQSLQKFNDEVPVVFIDGRKAFKYRMDRRQFLRKLAERT
jgi:glutaredoxin